MRSSRGVLAAVSVATLSAAGQAFAQTDSGVETVVVTAERHSENIQAVPSTVTAYTARQIQDLGIQASSDLGQMTSNFDIALPAGAGNQPIITIRGIGLNDYDTNNAGPNGVYIDDVYLSSPASQTFSIFDLSDIEVLKGPQGTLRGRNASGGAVLFSSTKPGDDFTAELHADYSSYDTVTVVGAVGGPISDDLDYRVAFKYDNSAGYMHNLFNGQSDNGANDWAGRAMLQYKPTASWTILLNIHGGQVATRPAEYRHLGAFDANGANCTSEATHLGQCVDLYGYGTPAKFLDGDWSRLQHLDVNNYGTYLNAEYRWGSLTFTSISAAEHNDKIHPENTDASASQLLDINFGVRNNTLTQEFRVSQTTDDYHWQAGFYYLWEDLHQNQPLTALLDIDTVFGVPGLGDGLAFQAFDNSFQVTNAYALYADGDYNITSRLKATLGGRGTYESKTFNYLGTVEYQSGGQGNFGPVQLVDSSYGAFYSSAFNYRAILDYAFDDDVHTYAGVASGYKSADFNGSFLSTVPAVTQQQLVPAKPEYVTTFDVGIKSQWFEQRLTVNAEAFYNDYRDMQLFILAPAPASICPVPGPTSNCLPNNILSNADAFTAGADIEVAARPFDGLTGKIDAGILTTKINKAVGQVAPGQPSIEDEQLTLSPHLSLSSVLDYIVAVPGGHLDLMFNANYKGHQFFDLAKFQDGTSGPFLQDPYTQQNGYWILNARAGYEIGEGQWEVAAWIRNIANKEYYSDEFNLQSPFGFIQGIVGQPRTIGGEINFKY